MPPSLNEDQFPSHMTAAELHDTMWPAELGYGRDRMPNDRNIYYANKLREASVLPASGSGGIRGPGEESLASSVRREGVRDPVTIVHGSHVAPAGLNGPLVQAPVLRNGAHRIAVAYDADPNQLVPLKHVSVK